MSQVSHVMPNSCNTICTDSRGMNYCPVATVTPRMQKTPRRGLKNGDLWDLISKNHSSDRGAGVRSEREKRDWQGKSERKKRDSDTVRRKWEEEEEEGESRRGFTSSNLQQCFRQFRSLLSLYFYKESRNTSSAIHFISIPTPASHLHSVSCTSHFHFSACHYISWMITYWQFLHWHRMGQDTTLPASKAGGRWGAFFQPRLSFSFSLRSSTLTPSPPLRFHPPQTLDQIQIFAFWPLWALAGPGDSPGTWGRIACLASPQQQMNQALNSSPDWLSWHPCQ